ncbi:MAG TPA: Ig-like domain-containing protein, partial [Spirochaetota bacterium]|nr:Ig-like domain-containing protein [Spirochaetota bacterium]
MKKLNFFFLLFLVIGCDAYPDFDRPEVVSVTPSHNSTLIPAGSDVVVEFSKSMDTIKTSNEFSLSSGSEKIEG